MGAFTSAILAKSGGEAFWWMCCRQLKRTLEKTLLLSVQNVRSDPVLFPDHDQLEGFLGYWLKHSIITWHICFSGYINITFASHFTTYISILMACGPYSYYYQNHYLYLFMNVDIQTEKFHKFLLLSHMVCYQLLAHISLLLFIREGAGTLKLDQSPNRKLYMLEV